MDKNQKVIKNIFVVLTYRNYEDLQNFIDSVNDRVKSYKIIVVNSFFDDDCMEIIKNIALSNNCEFLNIPNKGYSFGNNVGVRYALENFRFEHLVISNADIIVQNFDTSQLEQGNIYCGELITLRGNNQNPMIIYNNKISDWLIYKGYKRNKKFFLTLGIGINKIIREGFRFFTNSKKQVQIFQPHGAFIVFTRESIKQLRDVFDEKVFLFGEEGILAKRARSKGIRIFYTKYFSCLHKEDGSVGLFKGDISQEYRKAIIYYYENYCQNKVGGK